MEFADRVLQVADTEANRSETSKEGDLMEVAGEKNAQWAHQGHAGKPASHSSELLYTSGLYLSPP